MSDNELTEIRAALSQLARALETERAAVLRILKVIEKQMDENPIPVGYNVGVEVKG